MKHLRIHVCGDCHEIAIPAHPTTLDFDCECGGMMEFIGRIINGEWQAKE